MINSRNKGKVYERQWAELLRERGYTSARRGVQYCGKHGAADVVCDELPCHFEVKSDERLNIYSAIEQACGDCPTGKWRCVAHTKRQKGWLVTMPAEDWLDLIKEWKERSC